MLISAYKSSYLSGKLGRNWGSAGNFALSNVQNLPPGGLYKSLYLLISPLFACFSMSYLGFTLRAASLSGNLFHTLHKSLQLSITLDERNLFISQLFISLHISPSYWGMTGECWGMGNTDGEWDSSLCFIPHGYHTVLTM